MAALKCPIPGVCLKPLPIYQDARGALTEIFRAGRNCPPVPVQWNVIQSNANVMRGVHVHKQHVDYIVLLTGHLLMGLSDLRVFQVRKRFGCLLEIPSNAFTAVEIPAGVAHGFYFTHASMLLHGSSEFFDPADELYCPWNDPGLNIPWPKINPVLSLRDQQRGSLNEVLKQWHGDAEPAKQRRKSA